MRYILLIVFFFLVSCQDTRLENPKPSDVEGLWETLSVMQFMPYGLLKMNTKGEGVLIGVNEEAVGEIVRFHSFKTHERKFELTMHLVNEGELDEPIQITGSIDRGQLCFNVPEDEKFQEHMSYYWVCFTRSEKVNDFRKQAKEFLKDSEK